MIDKDKTVARAIAKYHTIFPIKGKQSLYECFSSLRGDTFLTFRTKDKKIHCIKASETHTVYASLPARHEVFDSIIKALNTPIIIRSLITKKPVKTCLINLFPVPTISWSTNKSTTSNDNSAPVTDYAAVDYPTPDMPSELPPSITDTAAYPRFTQYEVASKLHGTPDQYAEEQCPVIGTTTSYHYEILATGLLPVTSLNSWMPGLSETSVIPDTRQYSLSDMQHPALPGQQYQESSYSAHAPLYNTTTEGYLRSELFPPQDLRPLGNMPFLHLGSR